MFCPERAQEAVDFVQMLTHTKGEWAGKPFVLQDWQITDIINPIFGNLKPDGFRMVQTAYIEIPRKNGKTELIAALGLLLMVGDNEPGAEVYSAAADREQAAIIFRAAVVMVENNPALRKRCKIIESQKRIVYRPTNSVFVALSSDAYSKHGQNAHAVLYDELHAAPNRDLWDVLSTSMGARRQPLMIAITTAGFDRSTICYEQHDYAERVIAGTIIDPTFHGYIRAAGPDDDWKDEATWYKANPNLGVSIKLAFLQKECFKAMNIPAAQNTFKRLYLNIWTQQVTRWMDMDVWMSSAGPSFNIEDMKGRRCFAALDLSSSLDLTALVLAFPMEDETVRLVPHFWIPQENLKLKIDRDRVPYDAWVRDGFITATPGKTIKKDFIKKYLEDAAKLYRLEQIAYDPWSATELVKDLLDEGLTMVEFRQGYASMSPASKEFLKCVTEARIHHGNNPVMNWMAGNITVKEDPTGSIKPDKSTSTSRIDGIIASIMAVDGALRDFSSASVYEERGLRSL